MGKSKSPARNNKGQFIGKSKTKSGTTTKVPPKKVAIRKGESLDKLKSKSSFTRIVVNFDVGFENELFVRGQGADLNWEHGYRMTNVDPGTWVWESTSISAPVEFKVLINDLEFEEGENHVLQPGSSLDLTPSFSSRS